MGLRRVVFRHTDCQLQPDVYCTHRTRAFRLCMRQDFPTLACGGPVRVTTLRYPLPQLCPDLAHSVAGIRHDPPLDLVLLAGCPLFPSSPGLRSRWSLPFLPWRHPIGSSRSAKFRAGVLVSDRPCIRSISDWPCIALLVDPRSHSLHCAAGLAVVWEIQVPLLAQLSAPLFAVSGLTIQCGPEESQDSRSVKAFQAK